MFSKLNENGILNHARSPQTPRSIIIKTFNRENGLVITAIVTITTAITIIIIAILNQHEICIADFNLFPTMKTVQNLQDIILIQNDTLLLFTMCTTSLFTQC